MAELADIIRNAVISNSVNASKEQWQVLNAIMNCQTEALGGHIYRCRNCSKDIPTYNSCRNRHCPKCQGGEIGKWLNAREAELINAPYFHIVFTIPHELNGIALQNKKVIYNILFKAASKTLKEVAKTKLKGKIGFFSVLHTWGQKLEAHPHLHCVVPGVVIKDNGKVKKTSKKYFLPQQILKTVFRATFLKLLEKSYSKLEFHGEQSYLSNQYQFKSLLIKLTQKVWIVFPKKPFKHASLVLKYLARYTLRVDISNKRIISFKNDKVTFSYKDYKDGAKRKPHTLSSTEFVRRFLLHTLPKGFTRIRYFGFLAPALKAKSLKLIETILARPAILSEASKKPACPHCGCTAFTHIQKLRPKITLIPHCTSHTKRNLPLVA